MNTFQLSSLNSNLQKIRGMDINGLSDSYCKVTLVPPIGKVRSWWKGIKVLSNFWQPKFAFQGCNQQCTKTVHKSINPSYNATLHFGGIGAAYVSSGSLCLAILGILKTNHWNDWVENVTLWNFQMKTYLVIICWPKRFCPWKKWFCPRTKRSSKCLWSGQVWRYWNDPRHKQGIMLNEPHL